VRKTLGTQKLSGVVTVTGGTGSFGSTMVRDLLSTDVGEIRVFSRDENKQDLMRNDFKDERIRYFIGDVRDKSSVNGVIKGTDYVFHAAALKQVPSCEFFPMQAAATNLIGSSNVIESSIHFGVKSVVCLSTDKAVYPINAMGMSKALMEKVAQSYTRNTANESTRITVTRYGNVMMSRGSVIPLFIRQILATGEVTVTNPNMTRFLMSLSESVDLVKYAFENGESGDLFVRKAPACTVATLVEGIGQAIGYGKEIRLRNIGTRHGEKLFESLLSSEESIESIDMGNYFRVPLDSRSMDYQIFFTKGREVDQNPEPYTSHNTERLSAAQVGELISSLPEFKRFMESA
jgi:UDP-N-acetylglucosamine 4,6-dehydratase/5-epimerase